MVKVALDQRIFVYQKYGGISRYFVGIAENLDRHGIDPKVFAPIHVNSYLSRLPASKHVGIRLPAGRFTSATASRISSAAFPLFTASWKPRIVHETYFGWTRQAPKGAALVLTIYDMIHELYPKIWGEDRTIERKRHAIERADKIICISESTRRDLIRFYPETEAKAVVTLLGFDPNDSATVSVGIERTEKPYILYVGYRDAYKNFSRLWKAYSASESIHRQFDLVCLGGGRFSGEDQARIAAAGLQDSVRQEDAEDAWLQYRYRHAAAFVYPSEYEGFGIPPLEAMAANCPTIVSRSSSIPEVCGDASEYFDPASTDELIAALEAVLLSPSRAQQLRSAGAKRLQSFSWDKCAAETAAIYRAIA